MAKFAYPIPNGKVNSEGLTKLISTLYTGSGVVFADSLTVSASDTPDMNVVVSGSQKNDVAVFIADSGIAYTGWNNNDENVVIDANSTGVTMIDTIIAYIDLSAGDAETANAPDGLSFMAIRGATADTAPTDGAINTAVGHSLWIRLANVSVSNGASSINSGNITDVRDRALVDGEQVEVTRHIVPFQTDNGNTIASNADSKVLMQAGWAQMAGSGTQNMSQSVVFPTPFTTLLGVIVTFVGVTGADSNPASNITDFDAALTVFSATAHAQNPSVNGFTSVLTVSPSNTFSSTRYYGYSWIAWGT